MATVEETSCGIDETRETTLTQGEQQRDTFQSPEVFIEIANSDQVITMCNDDVVITSPDGPVAKRCAGNQRTGYNGIISNGSNGASVSNSVTRNVSNALRSKVSMDPASEGAPSSSTVGVTPLSPAGNDCAAKWIRRGRGKLPVPRNEVPD